MNFKTDKEDRSCDDIAFLYEIITNFVYGKLGHCLNPFNSEYRTLAEQRDRKQKLIKEKAE